LASSIALYLLSSVWFIFPSPFEQEFFFLFVLFGAFRFRNHIDEITGQRFQLQAPALRSHSREFPFEGLHESKS